MSYQIALTFEDGVTRFIENRDGEIVADASYRSRINIPLDCRDGVCGTCKSFCESGEYELGDYVEGEAMTEDEEAAGYVLTCQMTPLSDCVINIPATSDVAKAGASEHSGEITAIDHLSETTMEFSIRLDNPSGLGFLPGQYVNLQIPNTDQTRSYSFSSGPQAEEVTFLLRNTPTGALPTYLRGSGQVGDRIELKGPLGSFYLRPVQRPVLFLAGGTGLAPFLSMLHKLMVSGGAEQPIHLIFGVTNDADLVKLDVLDSYVDKLPGFSYACCVADESSSHPNKGYVTRYVEPQHLNGGDVDVYLCGPPPMVDAVRGFLSAQNVAPTNFYFEKFSGSGLVVATGEEHLKPADSDEAFDTRMVIELGAAQLTVEDLGDEQLHELRRLAEATEPLVIDGHFTDPAAFRDTNAAFHQYLVELTGNATLVEAYKRLSVLDYMAQALTPDVDVVGDIVQDHLDLVTAYERHDLGAVRDIIVAHTQHAKATMRAGIEKAGAAGGGGTT
jgi:benzoate/toluate 1,2-dioxygenase reductase subunit